MLLKKIGIVVGCFGLYHLAKRFVGVRPGMFVAPDNRIYRGMPEGGPVSGVVGFVDGDKALALCLTERSYPWSSSCISVPETRTMTSGLAATRKILETARKLGKKAEAAVKYKCNRAPRKCCSRLINIPNIGMVQNPAPGGPGGTGQLFFRTEQQGQLSADDHSGVGHRERRKAHAAVCGG